LQLSRIQDLGAGSCAGRAFCMAPTNLKNEQGIRTYSFLKIVCDKTSHKLNVANVASITIHSRQSDLLMANVLKHGADSLLRRLLAKQKILNLRQWTGLPLVDKVIP
jgi:hypothetical protein